MHKKGYKSYKTVTSPQTWFWLQNGYKSYKRLQVQSSKFNFKFKVQSSKFKVQFQVQKFNVHN